jgi:lantibiotic modifying enzyme
MALLHLWLNTGDPDLLERATACADNVLKAARRDGVDWAWPTPEHVDSGLAGINVYGFAHGIAGVGAFLLAAAEAGGSEAHREAALGAGDTLVRAASIEEGIPAWPVKVGGGDVNPSAGHWCSGPAGIGTFLVRLGSATGDQRFTDLAQRCVPARKTLWHSTIGACCGLAGVGHAVLDLADIGGWDHFRGVADHIADLIHARRRIADDLELICPPSRGMAYNEGTSGVLTFLLRHHHGGPNPWMPHKHSAAT